jgi:hypothetical protein
MKEMKLSTKLSRLRKNMSKNALKLKKFEEKARTKFKPSSPK